jgi:alkaline phosphatase
VLIVENGNIDVSGHHGDATAMYYEVKDLSNAFERAVNYSMSRRDTLVLLTADHETGGIFIFPIFSRQFDFFFLLFI